MKTTNIGNFKLGIDMLSEETALPKGAARDAVNVDILLGGGFRRRRGTKRLASFSGAHSLWSPRSQTYALYAHADALRQITRDVNVRTLTTGLEITDRMAFCEAGTEIIFTNGVSIGIVDVKGAVRMIGVAAPDNAPLAFAQVTGGLLAGRYGCAYSFLNAAGEESGLSPAAFVTLAQPGSVRFKLPEVANDIVELRLYLTSVNGDVLYQMAQVPAGLTNYTVGDDTPGKAATTQFMHRMPGGSIVRVYKGRVMVARGDMVVFSEPYNYGLTSRRHNFIQFGSDVTMLEPVEGGVYVGTEQGVFFLAGDGPKSFTQSVASTNIPVMGASVLLDASALPEDMERLSDAPVALWLGRFGYSVGLNTGLVHDVQSDRIDLPSYEAGSVVTCTKNGLTQVISVVQSDQSNGAGSAIDTPT